MKDKLLLERWNIMAGLSEEDEVMMPDMDDASGEMMPDEMGEEPDALATAWSDWLMGADQGSTLADLVDAMAGMCTESMEGGTCMLEVPEDSELSVSVYAINSDPSAGTFTVVKDDEEDVETADSVEAALAAAGLDAARDMGISGEMLTALEEEFAEMMGAGEESEEESMEDMLEESRLLDLLRRARSLNRR